MAYKLTYSTMFDPPPEMHTRFDTALAEVRAALGRRHSLHIAGKDIDTGDFRDKRSPIDRDWLLGSFSQATVDHADQAMRAASDAFPRWRATPPAERIRLLRRVAQIIEDRVYQISAAVALEVGKNRMEALGEVQETADFFNVYCDSFESQGGFDHVLPNDPLPNVGVAQSQRDEAVRCVGRHQPVQFSVRARGRSRGRGARHGQHGRAQGRE